MSVEKCIGDEISVYIRNHPEAKERELEWKEVADHIKENLVGVKRPMVEVTGNEKDGYEFNLTGESRVLTPEDIDRIRSLTDGRTMMVFDRFDRPMLLFANQFTLNYFIERHPDVELLEATEV